MTTQAASQGAPMTTSRGAAWFALAVLTLVGAWLRLPVLEHGVTPDEFATIVHGNAWLIFSDPESGVNPPLIRLLFNVPFEEPGALAAGRWFSWLCGTLAIPLAFEAARRATGGSVVAGLTAAVLVTFHPYAIRMSGRFRAYTPWMATMGLHLVALHAWRTAVDAAEDVQITRWRRIAVGTAILLPWWHYQSVPLLLLLGGAFLLDPRWRPAFRFYIPAGLIVSPMAILVLRDTSARVPHSGTLARLMARFLALDLQSMPAVAATARRVIPNAQQFGDPTHLSGAILVSAVLVAAILLLLARRLSDLERVLLYGTVGLLGGSALLSYVQLVRTPTVVMIVVFAAPLLAAVLHHLPGRVLPALASVALLGGLLHGAPPDVARARFTPDSDDLRTFASEFHRFDDARGDLPIRTWPQYTWVGMYYYLEGHHVRHLDEDPRASCGDGCFEHDGIRFEAIRQWEPATQGPGLYAAFGEMPEADMTACTPLHEARWYHVWRCGTPTP